MPPSDSSPVFGDRRLHLAALDAVVTATPGLACGIVTRRGVPMLNAITIANPTRMTEVGCDFVDGDWWYVSSSGEKLGPVADPQRVTNDLAEVLSTHTTRGR